MAQTDTLTPEASLDALVSQLPKELQDKARQQLAKLQAQADKVRDREKFNALNEALQPKILNLVKSLAGKYGVNLAGRKIVVSFAGNGTEPTFSHTPIRGSGNGNRQGFPTGWGKATYEGKEYASPSALASELGLKINGHKDMVDVFVKAGYKVDAVKGKHFTVTK